MALVIPAAAAFAFWLSDGVEAPDKRDVALPVSTAGAPAQPPLTTQGQLAQQMAGRLGLGTGLPESRAIGLLASRGIAPSAGWMHGAPATEATIAEIQRSFHVALTDVANDLQVVVPPTLNLQIFDAAYRSGQTLHADPRAMTRLLPGGGNVDALALGAGRPATVSIAAPFPFPVGDERLPAVWSYRLRHPGAQFIELHFDKLSIAAPSYIRVLDTYGQERWRHIGGDPPEGDIVADAVPGDTAIIVLHAGAVAAGSGLHIDRYRFGPPPTVTTSQ